VREDFGCFIKVTLNAAIQLSSNIVNERANEAFNEIVSPRPTAERLAVEFIAMRAGLFSG
jgi:hypothetical protein